MTFSHKCRKPAFIVRVPERGETYVRNSAGKIFAPYHDDFDRKLAPLGRRAAPYMG